MLLWQKKKKKSKKEKSRLQFIIINVRSIWEEVWVSNKNDWILSPRYNLQRPIILFHEAEIFSFSKNFTSMSPFLIPLSTPLYCMWRKSTW